MSATRGRQAPARGAHAGLRPGPDVARARLEVAVLMGGGSGEREVSLQSGAQIVRSLSVADGRGPARVRPVELTGDGAWVLAGEPLEATAALERLSDTDVFFLGLHGGSGEDGTLQGLLAGTGRVHTGSGVAASALCMDKVASRALARDLGLAVADGVCVPQGARFEAGMLAGLPGGGGWAVKPRRGGSSVTTFVVGPGEPLEEPVAAVQNSGDDCLVEAAVAGVEVSCGVLGNPGEELHVLPAVEIQPAAGRFFDYQQKYDAGGARERCPAVSLTESQERAVRDAARRFYVAAGCAGYARLDFIVPPAAAPVLLEANTLPGFTARSLLPLEALEVGLDHRDLCLFVLDAALRAAGRRP